MAKASNSKTLIKLYGQQQPLDKVKEDSSYFQLEESYVLSSLRAGDNEHLVTVNTNEYIQLTFDDGSTWFGDNNTLTELFPEINFKSRSANDAPALPMQLQSDDTSRGIASQIILKLFKKFTKKIVDDNVIKIAKNYEVKCLNNRSGLYSVDAKFNLVPFKSIDTSKPALLFIHGTASSTTGSFGSLPDGAIWDQVQGHYNNNIIAFEHETFTKSPLQNVYELIQQLPKGTHLDVVTHSRGGIVGEILMRFIESNSGFPAVNIELLKKENRKDDLFYIDAIEKLIGKKELKIRRFVRVACPARGTSLLGKRIDIFINVLINLINVSNPVLSPLVESLKALISQILEERNDPSVLPGIEVMNPESVFLKALNSIKSYDNEIPRSFDNRLLVISGNSKFSASLNGVKVLLTKFFFKWGDNDLVVDTPSMYQGARRNNPVQYFLDEGTNVNHFNYFSNKKTQDAIAQALFSQPDRVIAFKEMNVENYGELERGIFGLDGGKLGVKKADGKRPVVLLLPGIMGSVLERGSKSLWINYLSFVFGGLTKLKLENKDVKATGIIKTAYKDLAEYLSATYDVEVFPFDWRKPISESGAALNARIIELQQFKQPVKLIGHSMGGLIIRDMVINYPDTWNWLNAQRGFKTILLGTPWMGSYRIAHVLSGRDSIIKQLDTIDLTHTRAELIDMFSKFPGLLGLLPVRHVDVDFGSKKEWEAFAQATGLQWQIPGDEMLKAIAAFKKSVNDNIHNIDYKNIIYVAGKDDATVNGYKIENGQLTFTTTAEGDQSVPWESGIPEHLNRETSLYYTTATHGGLSTKKYLFAGIRELLDKGTTASPEFSRKPLPATTKSRGICKEIYHFDNSERGIEANLLGLDVDLFSSEASLPVLKVSVSKGDLMYAKHPVLLGHFAYDGIYSAEAVANKYLNNILSIKHSLGIYPGDIGSNTYFPGSGNAFKGCIITGLGNAENLNAYQLTKTIESAVSNYLLTEYRDYTQQYPNSKKKIGVSSLIIGAGYGGMPIESSCRAIMQGIINANDKVLNMTGLENLYVDELEFIELFEDKSITCFYSLANFINGNSDGMNITWQDKKIKKLPGVRKRLLGDTNVAAWQRLSIIAKDEDCAGTRPSEKVLSYYSSTNNAREEKQDLHHNIALLESLLDDISIRKNWSFEKAKAIFELLIPANFKENIRRNSPILWVLDEFTASFPWELLHTGNASDKPLCVSAGMMRQLATSTYKPFTPVKNNNVLVIGDPNLNGYTKAGQLPGAAREAKEVFEKLKANTDLVVEPPIINGSTDEILTALYKQEYKILHIAAHGFFDAKDPMRSGVLIGKKKDTDEAIFLTPQHIAQLPNTPEFVFINCCFLGKINPYAEEYSANRFKLAANIGTQLIQNGVKAVVVAGWEVDDSAALVFANELYDRLLNNYNFGDSVQDARKSIYEKFKHTNTWGAFQCYGQQHYTLNLSRRDYDGKKSYDIPQVAENDLDNLISRTEVAFYDQGDLLNELLEISTAIKEAGFNSPELKQKEALAYMELNDYETSTQLYNDLFKTEDASFDVRALEDYQDITVKKEVAKYLDMENPEPEKTEAVTGIINKSIHNLNFLLEIWKTGQRYALIASAYKRKARILNGKEKIDAMEATAYNYFEAYQKLNDSYSFTNWMIMEVFLTRLKKQKWGSKVSRFTGIEKQGKKVRGQYTLPSLADIKKLIDKLLNKASDKNRDQGYWEFSEIYDLNLCQYLLSSGNDNFKGVKDSLQELWSKTGAKDKKQKQIDNVKLLIHYSELCGLLAQSKKLKELVN